jgi:hypothetical protein
LLSVASCAPRRQRDIVVRARREQRGDGGIAQCADHEAGSETRFADVGDGEVK